MEQNETTDTSESFFKKGDLKVSYGKNDIGKYCDVRLGEMFGRFYYDLRSTTIKNIAFALERMTNKYTKSKDQHLMLIEEIDDLLDQINGNT